MLRGEFREPRKAAYLQANVTLPRLGLSLLVDFHIDTGAESTMLLPKDTHHMNIAWDELPRVTRAAGLGGTVSAFREFAVLQFEGQGRLWLYGIDIALLSPSVDSAPLPSVLGRDVLNNWRMHCSPVEDTLTFDVLRADASVPV